MLTHLASGFGSVTTGILMLFGLYATVKTHGGAFRSFPAMFRQIKSPQQTGRPISPFRAFATSLAGTIGVGNITGVALAITLGGAGSVFWMWISALLCMTVKQFELYLAVKHQPKDETHYGFAPMVYIKKVTENKGFAGLFALFALFSALTMGSMIQTDAAVHGANSAFGIPPWATALLFTAGIGFFLSGGIPRVMGALEKALPILGGVFLLTGLTVVAFRCHRILPALSRIFTEAFSFSSLSGGILGSGFALGFRYGVGSGLFSHEAGLGSGGLAHGACGADPLRQSLWGIFEVFFDTIVISTVSALMILTTDSAGSSEGVLSAAYNVLGPVGEGIVALCLVLFAFLSVLSWSCYGETCFVWLTSKKGAVIYRILFLCSPVASLFASQTTLWSAAEIINGGMMILNLTALFGHREELKNLRARGRCR